MNDLTTKRTLFQIGADAMALNELLEELEGDVSDPAVADAIDEWLSETGASFEAKLDGYAALIGERLALSKARKDEAKRLTELARGDEGMAARLKERLQRFFEENGIEKKETARYKFTLAQNGGVLPLILSEDITPADVGDEFTSRVFDNAAIRAALESGMDCDFAALGARGTSLRIK